MTDYKGTGIDFARKLLSQRGIPEEQLVAKLSPDDASVFRATTSLSWLPTQVATRILTTAAGLVFPGDRHGVWEMGRLMAHDNMTGLYKVLMRVVSVQTVMDRAAKLWTTYHAHGTARAELRSGGKGGRFVVEGYPQMAVGMLESIAGYVQGLLEMTGAQGVQVVPDGSNPNAWVWKISWP